MLRQILAPHPAPLPDRRAAACSSKPAPIGPDPGVEIAARPVPARRRRRTCWAAVGWRPSRWWRARRQGRARFRQTWLAPRESRSAVTDNGWAGYLKSTSLPRAGRYAVWVVYTLCDSK